MRAAHPALAALTGLAAGAVTVGAASLVAGAATRWGWLGASSSPTTALGSAFIDLTPAWLKDWAIATFSTRDKLALTVGMVLVIALACVLVGVLGAPRRLGGRGRPRVALAVVLALGVVAVLAVTTRSGSGLLDVLPTLLGLGLGWVTLRALWGAGDGLSTAPTGDDGRAEPDGDPRREQRRQLTSRRRVLGAGLALVAAGTLSTLAGQALGAARSRLDQARTAIASRLRPASVPAGAQAPAEARAVPFLTPNDDFYRIDTAFVPPVVDPGSWRLRVVGMVAREVEITLDDLLAKPLTEAMVTLACVSNPVGGPLVGNAVWTGWPVRELLAEAGPLPGADMVLSRSVDGFTASTPLSALTDERNALVAVGMNGEPLSVEHGFPARLVVPGLYGYVSATKWVTELKVTRFADDVAYWTTRGWSDRAPIKTASRFDVPVWDAELPAGETILAGVAWAQTRGISAVEVSIDWEPWQQATLATEPTIDAWRQWWLVWQATPGPHTLIVRATDGSGEVQDVIERRPDPDGATGHHTIKVTVR